MTVGQFVYVVRKRIKLSAEKAIFVFIKNTLPPTGKCSVISIVVFVSSGSGIELKPFVVAAALMSSVYEENKDEDGFLYMTYSGENTFGSH